MPEQKDVLARIASLNEDEAKIYSLIMTSGNLTKGDLSLLTSMPLGGVETILTKLESEKLIVTLRGITSRYQAVPPFSGFVKEIEGMGQKIDKVQADLRGQVKSASGAIRGDLTSIADSALKTIEDKKAAAKTVESGALADLRIAFTEMTKSLDETPKSLERELQNVFAEWKGAVQADVVPVSAEMKNVLSSASGSMVGHIKTWSSNAATSIESAKRDIRTVIDDYTKTVTSGLTSDKAAIIKTLDIRLKETQAALQKSNQQIRERFSSVKDSLSGTVSSQVQGFSSSIEKNQQDLESIMQSSSDEITGRLDNMGDSVISSVESLVNAEQKQARECESSLVSAVDAFLDRVNKSTEAFDSGVTAASGKFESKSETTFASIDGQLNDLLASSQAQIAGAMDRMKAIGAEGVQVVFDTTRKTTKELVQETNTSLNRARDEFKASVEAVGNQLKELNKNSLATHKALLEAIGQLADSTASQTNQNLASERDRIRSMVRAQISECSMKHNEIQASVERGISQQVASHNETIKQILGKTSGSVDRLVGEIDTVRRQKQGEMDERLGETKKTAVDTILRMGAESRQLVQAQRENLQETLNLLGIASSEVVSAIQSSGTSSADEIKKKAAEWRESIDEALRQTADAARESISTVTAEGKSQIESATSAERDSAGAVLGRAKEQTTSQLTMLESGIAQALVEGAESVSSGLAAAASGFGTDIGTSKAAIVSSADAIGSGLSEKSLQGTRRLETTVKGVTDALDTLTRATESETTSMLEASKGSIDVVNKKLVDSVVSVAGGHRDLAVKAVTSSLNTSKSNLMGLQARLSKIVESSWEGVGTTLASLKDGVNRIVADANKSEMIGITDETLAKVFPTSVSVDSRGAEIAKVLTSAWQTASAADFPGAKKTWTVVTQKAVLAHIQDMIGRAKSKVTLIVPRADEVPADLLAKMKSTIGVEVVMTEEPKLPDKIRALVGKGNIRIRTRAEKDVYACVRDSEEMLLAPAATKEEDVIGVVTEEEGFVRFIMGTVGPIFQSKTKLIRPEDQ